MYCIKCGTQLPDEAEFCWKCGQAQDRDLIAASTISTVSSSAAPPITRLACPSCGGMLPIPEGDSEFVTCQFCHSNSQLRRNVGKLSLVLVEPEWETCEIVWKKTYSGNGYFQAEAIGPGGPYIVTKTKVFMAGGDYPNPHGGEAGKLLNDLISELVSFGWESTNESGHNWWNKRFRRRTDIPTWDICELFFNWRDNKFVARASGPQGVQIVAESLRLKTNWRGVVKDHEEKKEVYHNLIDQITRDGWELLKQGDKWNDALFRHRNHGKNAL